MKRRESMPDGRKTAAVVALICIILVFAGVILVSLYYARDKEEEGTKSAAENTEIAASGADEEGESGENVSGETTDGQTEPGDEATASGQDQTSQNDEAEQQDNEENNTSQVGSGENSSESDSDGTGENGEETGENSSDSEKETTTAGSGTSNGENGTSNGGSNTSNGGSNTSNGGSSTSNGGSGTSAGNSSTLDEQIQKIIDSMTLEEKVAQLFVVTPEQLTGVGTATVAGETTRKAIEKCPVGGIIYFKKNIKSEDQIRTMLTNTQQYFENYCGFKAFLGVDEEGGLVSRLKDLAVPTFENLSVIGARGDTSEAYNLGQQIGEYLSEFGFNMDTAPVADVLTNPENTVVKYRSFGSDCNLVSRMAKAEWQGLSSENVIGIYKHFPGHGGTTGDTHEGYAYVTDTLEELKANALVPFQDAINAGVQVIMVGHISCPNVTGDETPASLSKMMITDILREDMGFDGIVITDALDMDAIAAQYTSAEAAVKALQAGADLLLMPVDFEAAYQGVIDAVNAGKITEERIEESLTRILRVKLQM